VVALIVKADDAGVALARYNGASIIGGAIRLLGRTLVRGMPAFLMVLSTIGTAAMIWVGGGIILHGIENYGPPVIGRTVHAATEAAAHLLPSVAGIIEWSVEASISGVLGLLVGALAIPAVEYGLSPIWKRLRRS
jgi:predicted DNA repair protein MutK